MQRRALSRKPPAAPAETPPQGAGAPPDLSPRQHQILGMLRAGKVNKEIAQALGIGLGTVKQHVVALFKKLDVSNRAMAVSRGMQMQAPSRPEAAALATEGVLEYRPCVVLSATLDESVPQEAGRKMQEVLAAYAAAHDALFLARKGHAGDLILGIQRASEQDLFIALRAARTVHSELAAAGAHASRLRCGLTAGLAVASMNRTGGWSGEAIASMAITQGRELAREAGPGELRLAPAVRELFCVQNPNPPGPAPEKLALDALLELPWAPGGAEPPPLGRDPELQLIDELLCAAAGGSRLLQVAGETGMGKSRLCRYAAERTRAAGGKAHHFVCRPDGDATAPFVSTDGRSLRAAEVFDRLASPPEGAPESVIVDDCHFLQTGEMAELARCAASAPRKLVMLAGRRFADHGVRPTHSVRLSRLSPEAMEQLARRALGGAGSPARTASIVRRAAGVPLFATELARQKKIDTLPLSLRALIGARLDGLRLDRALLRRIARTRAACDAAALARDLDEPAEAIESAAALALASGVLNRDGLGRFRFAHPLLRQAIDLAGVE